MSVNKHRGFRGKADRRIHEQHAEARALGFVRVDRRGYSDYLAQFHLKDPRPYKFPEFPSNRRLCRQLDGTWVATNEPCQYKGDAYESPAAAYVMAELVNWGRT